MPTARIEIEELSADRWHAHLETGSATARRAHYQGATLEEVMVKATAGYYELSGVRPKPTPTPKDGRASIGDRLVG